MDTIRGIPALADTDPAALIGQYSRDLRAAIGCTILEDAQVATPAIGTIATAKGVYDPSADSVSLRVQINGISVSSGNQNITLFTLAIALVPPVFTAWQGTWGGSGGSASGLISPGGVLSLRWSSAAQSNNNLYISTGYPA